MWEFLINGGPMMALLALTSLVGLAFILERAWMLRWGRVVPDRILLRLEDWKSSRLERKDVISVCRESGSPLGRLLHFIDAHSQWPREETIDGLEARARQEIVRLERGLVVLEVVVGIAPLMGLIGTIHGLMKLFGGIDDLGSVDGAVLAEGIAIALNTTMAGLLIAIPSLIAWSYFSKKVEAMAVELEGICGDFLRHVYREKET